MPRGPLLLLLASLLLPPLSFARAQDEAFPSLSGRVVDEAEILSDPTEARLVDLLAGHEQATANQVVVVTLSSLRGFDIADYGLRLGRAWGIGQEGQDNGVLLIVVPSERAVRIEVGYGLEGLLPDATARIIIQREILPAFRAGDLEGGVLQGTQAILAALGGGYIAPPDPAERLMENERLGMVIVLLIAGGLAAGAVWILRILLRQGGVVGGGGGGARGVSSGRSASWRPARGGWSSGGGFRGGGGSFGGGGASGRW
jgi:uncharacterized protein